MGPVPSSTVDQVSSRLDAKFESLWIKNKPSKWARYFRFGSKLLVLVGVLGGLGYVLSILWPKLMMALPQIDLSRTGEGRSMSEPKAEMAPPLIVPVAKSSSMAAAKTTSVVPRVVAPIVPTPVGAIAPPAAKPNFNVQTGNAIRLVVDNDKTQPVQVTVLNLSGALVRHLYQGSWDPGSHFVDWDGRNDQGVLVAAGNYTIVVKNATKTQSGIVTIQPNR